MTKEKLIRFFKGEASFDEMQEIDRWIAQSEANRHYAAELKILYVLSTMPQEEVGKGQMAFLQKGNSTRRFAKIGTVAAAAIILALLTVNILLVGHIRTNTPGKEIYTTGQLCEEMTRVYTEKGTKAIVTLPDSSRVWLNSDTQIQYSTHFAGKTRNVSLVGEAYFEVVKDSLKPMVIQIAGGCEVKVLGTVLHIKSYPNDNFSKTTLISGNIKVVFPEDKNGNRHEVSLNPSESLVIGEAQKPRVTARPKLQISKDVAWKEGELVFDKTPMPEVIKMLERWHGAEIIVENQKLYDYKLSASFKTESLIQIMEVINMLTGIRYSIEDNNRVLLK